jgi:hypothetical protein
MLVIRIEEVAKIKTKNPIFLFPSKKSAIDRLVSLNFQPIKIDEDQKTTNKTIIWRLISVITYSN